MPTNCLWHSLLSRCGALARSSLLSSLEFKEIQPSSFGCDNVDDPDLCTAATLFASTRAT
jgi:hypothetical protein